MPSQLDELVKSLQSAGYMDQTGPGTPTFATNVGNPQKPNQLDELIKSLNPINDPTISSNPATRGIGPDGVYNTSDFSTINIDKEVTNSTFRNMWNSFKRGIDEIQIATSLGKFEYSPFGEADAEIIDNYPDQKADLDTQLQRGLIDAGEYARQIESLDSSYQKALDARSQVQRDIEANQLEIENEPVSKDYNYKNYLIQQAGDKGSFWDKTIYSMPQVIGSSAALMVPQLAATFGSNITKALIRSSAAYVLGPEAGVPANVIGTVGAIGVSVAELLWGRAQESYGEIGGTIMQVRDQLMQQYADQNGIQIDEIPEEVQRQIRIQSRKGADMQFKQNMALAASDVAQAILMPGSQLVGNIGETLGTLGKTIKNATDYNRLTRSLRTIGQVYYGALGEKFEEGYQFAAGERASDTALNINRYVNKGLMANILTDSYDTASSLNYSLIPGIDLRGSGKYADNSEFQFSEDSGGMLGLFMSAIPTALSVSKDILNYRTATKKLAKDGVIDPDNKIFRLQNSVLKSYFDKEQVPYLLEAMRSLRNKKGENGEIIMSDTDFSNSITNIREAYKIYQSAIDKVNGLSGDKWLFFDSKELSQAKAMMKEELFHSARSTIQANQRYDNIFSNRENLKNNEHLLSGDASELNNYKTLINELENAIKLKEDITSGYLNRNMDTIANVGERSRKQIEARVEFLDSYIEQTQREIEEERQNLETLGISYTDSKEASLDLDTLNKQLLVTEMNLDEYQTDYNNLLKIKTYKQAKQFYNDRMQYRKFADSSAFNTPEGAEKEEPTDRTEESVELIGSEESYQEGYEEEVPEDTPTYTPTSELANFTGSSTEATPEGETYINDTIKNGFKEALDDLIAEADDLPGEKTAAQRIAALEQAFASSGIDLKRLKFGDLFKIFRDNFADDLDYVRDKFEMLRSLSQLYKSANGASSEELREIRMIELDSDNMILIGERKEFSTPPEQTPDNVAVANDEIIKNANKESSELEEGSGLKIISGLSLATKNIISGRTSTGEIGDFRENGQIQFVEDTDQQLINTNFVKTGDQVNLRITTLPENFDINDDSDQNYDLVNIEVYKTVKKNTPNGQVEEELLIGSLHRIQKLSELIAESSNLKDEEIKLREQRKNIIQSKSKSFKAEITRKRFGFLNKNHRSQQTSIANIFGQDPRVHISTVAASGAAIETRDGIVYQRGTVPLIPGATIVFVPNETNNGTKFIPLYVTKNQIKRNENILNKVTGSITEFLKTGSRKFMSDAEQYIYITKEPNESLGLKGVFWNYTKDGNVPYVNINGKRYSMKNIGDLKAALGNIYFTPNRNALSKVEGYEQEIIKSGLLTTNIQNNKVLTSRYNDGTYSFLQDGQQNQYFSQHTIELGNFIESRSNLPETKQTEPLSTDPSAEISRLRAERIQKAKELGFAFEGGKGSMKGLYDTVVSWLADPTVLGDPENTDDIISANQFLAMYEEYETRIEEVRKNNNISPESETQTTTQENPEVKEELDNMGIDINFDDLLGEVDGSSVDDIGEQTVSLESQLLVSRDISATLQNQMVDSIAYKLLTNEKPQATQEQAEQQDISNKDLVKKDLQSNLSKFRDMLTKPNTPEILTKLQTLVNNYELMVKHYDALYAKSLEVLNKLGFKQTDENSDYFENLEEQFEDNNATQFNDDSNSTRNAKNFLPAEVKKLIYFIPNLQERDLSNPKEAADMQNPKSAYFGKPYKAKPNSLGLPSFNDFNDTWEKTLSVISQRTYTSDDSGFNQMLETLQKEQNPIIVRELATRLNKANDQIKNAFFRRTYLQKQQNKTTIVNYRNNKSYKDIDGNWHQGTTVKTTQIINSDQRQGIRFIANQLEQEFRVNGLQKGILISTIEESTGRLISKVNIEYGKQLLQEIKDLINNQENFILEKAAVAKIKAKYSNKFTDNAKAQLLNIIQKTGINFSYGALSDLLRFYKVANAQSIGDERAVAIEIFQNTIFRRLAGLSGQTSIANSVQSEEEIVLETDYEVNNPFKKDPSTIQSLARYEFAFRVQNQSGSYRSNGKSYYPFTRHSYLSEMFTDITAWLRDRNIGDSAKKNVFAKLRTDHFAEYSLYLNSIASPVKNPEFAKIFKLRYELGTRNRASLDGTDKLLQEMTEREHQIAKITDFQNSGNRAAVMHYDTLSDKITKPVIDVLRQDIFYPTETQTIEQGNIVLNELNMDVLYRYFQAEYTRIQDVIRQNKTLEKHELIKGYHDIGTKAGMGKFFNIYYFLNKDVLDVDNPDLSSAMYNADGTLKEISGDVQDLIKIEINKHFNKIYTKTKQDFADLGLFNLENKNNRKEFDPLIQDMVDSNYLKKNVVKLGLENVKGLNRGQYYKLTQQQLNRIIDFAIVDYVVNYAVFSNEMLMFTGDPAQAGKLADSATVKAIKERFPDNLAMQKKFTTIANIESTFVNVGKRNAAFLGSGEKGKFQNSQYSVAIANDININSPQFEYYKNYFKGNEDAVERAYKNGDLTDAQEVTTVEEHLHTMMAFGQITHQQYKKFLYIYDRNHYNQIFPNSSESITAADRFEAFGIVMQPMKPVQRTYNLDNNLKISKQYYIKTSSYPLVPDMIKGTPLESLLEDMKKNKVQRVAFVSATKQGVAGSKNLFDKDGNYTEDFLQNNQNILERDGFRIQLEVPYKDNKDEIREGTQLAKLLFVDIDEDLRVSYQGKQTNIADLKKKYNDYHKAIIKIKTDELLEELGAEYDNEGIPIVTDLRKLAKIIQEEGIDRGYSINSLLGLDLNDQGQFKVPLTFLPNTGQIQPVLTAIVSNRIARLKMPGKSYVQGSEFVLNRGTVSTDIESVDQRSIVWTKPEYSGLSKLNYLREEKDKVKPAQIIMPFYFIGKNGKRIDLRNYTTQDKEGRTILDSSKIDPELLEMNGFRIPFQGHNSGMWFEIVGFLPYEMGDLIIVPGEIAAQMGSDYDVDKLYGYMFNYNINEFGNIFKVSSENPETIEAYQNALIDVHKSIFTSRELFQPILDPLSFADVEEAIAELGSEESKEFLGSFDPTYQRDVYFSNRGGQLGVGITANANTSHALAQSINLFIKGQGVIFLDENGKEYVDHPTTGDVNRVNGLNDNTYTYVENGDVYNQNDGFQKSAWRLDKIYTFTKNPKTGQPYKISNLISQLLGVSVDNAKEQKLGAYGLNKHNFNVAVSIVRAGFDLITTKAFINQPILKEYYTAIGATEDMFSIDFTPNKREQVVKDIFKKYGEQYNIDHNAIFNRDSVQGFTLADMRSSLEQNSITEANALQQLEVLKAFLHYKNISDGLQGLVSALNIDTKGLPKNVSETINKQEAIDNNVYSNALFGNTSKFVSETIPGLFAKLPTVFEGIFANPKNPLFAYSSAAYVSAQNKIQHLTGRQIIGQEKLDRFHNAIKQFLYTSGNIRTFNGSTIDEKRQQLLFDSENNKSLQTRFLELQAKHPQNDLLRAINPIISEYPNDPKQLEIVLSSEEDYTERIRQYWEFMLNNEEEGDLKDFATDLLNYAMLVSSQEYGTSNLIKYIPFSALDNIGFGEELNRINADMFQNEDLLEAFVNQFIQHDLDYVLAAKEKNFTKNSVVYDTITTIEGNKSVTRNTNVINKFSLAKYDPQTLDSNPAASLLREDADGNWDYPEVLSVFIDGNIGKLLYQKKQNPDGTVDYYRIDTLGGNNMSEYDFQALPEFKRSLFEANRSGAIIPFSSASTKIFETKIKENVSDDIPLTEVYFPTGQAHSVTGLLQTITGQLKEGDKYSEIFNNLAQAIGRYNLVLPIVVNNNHNSRATVVYNDTENTVDRIIFNPKEMFKSDRIGLSSELGGVRTILHELIHVLTLEQINNPSYNQSSQFRQLNSVWEEYQNIVRNQSQAKERGVNVNAFDAEVFGELVDRFRQFRGTNTKQSDIYTSDLRKSLQRVLENENETRDFLNAVGKRLQTLADNKQIESANYDLVTNLDRFNKFRERLANEFLPNTGNNINKYYAYYNIREFVTEAMTNPVFQSELKKIPSIWERFRTAIANMIARILGYDKNERSLLDDAVDATIDLIDLKFNQQQNQEELEENFKTDSYQYFGAKYVIAVDASGKGVSIPSYKGPQAKMQVILDAYNNNPDIDPQNGKYFRNPTKSQPDVQFHISREYRLPSGKIITFNDQQYEGLQKIDKWLKDPNQQFFTLAGFAGTGKTTIVKAILDTYKDKVVVTAPTHKAKNIISRTTNKNAETIQKLLGLRPNTDLENFDPNKPIFDPLATPSIGAYRWIILDEASMLNKSLFNFLISKAKANNTKILFMGDPAQIPPVGEIISDVFDSELVEEKYQLTKVERQAGSNPLMSVYDKIRSNISSSDDQFDHKTKLNSIGEGIEFTGNQQKFTGEVIRNFLSSEYEQDRNFAKVIAWRNDTVGLWNRTIRTALFGENARQYEEGDTIMAYTNITTPQLSIENSSDYVVKNVVELQNHGFYGFDGYRLTIKDIDEMGSTKVIFIVKNDQRNMQKYYEIYDQQLNQAKATKRWKTFYNFRNNNLLGASIMSGKQTLVAKDFDYGYAITAHKSQGSTFTNAFIVEGDIDANSDTTERNKLKYVAFSRPTTKVLSFTQKTQEEGTNTYIEQDDMLLSLPRDVNEVTDKELNELINFCK